MGEYKIEFTDFKDSSTSRFWFAEIELPGHLEASSTPTLSPSVSPSGTPSSTPSLYPSTAPSVVPSAPPSEHPTVDLPDDGNFINNILMQGSSVQSLGCSSVSKARQAKDGTTDKYGCYRNKSETQSIIVSPVHDRLSIAKSIRLYTSNSNPKQDPTSFALYGRVDSHLPWMEVSRGIFPGVAEGLPRNNQGIVINSTYKNGDDNLIYSEVKFPSNAVAYLNYKIEFTGFKDSSTSWFRFAEIELPGHLEASSTPTLSPSISPSKNPTSSPSGSPTPNPTDSPTLKP